MTPLKGLFLSFQIGSMEFKLWQLLESPNHLNRGGGGGVHIVPYTEEVCTVSIKSL